VSARPSGYPDVGVPYDGVSTLLNSYPDWDHFTSISPRLFHSYGSGGGAPGFYGMNCDLNNWPYRDFIKGSPCVVPSMGMRRSVRVPTRDTNFFLHVQNATREVKYLSRSSGGHNIDDRAGSELTFDWDMGHTKAECRAHYVATGLAQIETGEVDAIICNKVDDVAISNISSRNQCTPLPFDLRIGKCVGPDGSAQNQNGTTCSADNAWAPGVVANTCGKNQYLKGISKASDTSGHLNAMLCCNFP
jgi:hypothetical protein